MNNQSFFISRPERGEGESFISHCQVIDGLEQLLFASHPPSLSFFSNLFYNIKMNINKALQIMTNIVVLQKRNSNAKKESTKVLHSFQPYTLSELSMLSYNLKCVLQ